MNRRPKAILLDLGNVTVRLRTAHFLRSFGEACAPKRSPAELIGALKPAQGGHHDYERGRIDGPAFHRHLKEALGLSLDYPAWLRLWNDFFEPNRPMEALVARLRGQARFWALSNTNAEHLTHLNLNFRVFDTFEGITASHLVGAAKPDAAIYKAAIKGLGLKPEQILYLDDVADYVAAGREHGLQAFHYTFNDAELRAALLEMGFELPPLSGASVAAC